MWNKPFGYSEYILIGGGVTFIGAMLQITVGAIDWSLIAFPANVILLCLFVAIMVTMHLMRGKVYLFRCISESRMAVVAIATVTLLTFVMGMLRQDGAASADKFSFGFHSMLHAWWYVLPFIWLTLCLGLTALRRTIPFHFRDLPFMLNHWGLFVVLLCATLGSADIQQLNMPTFPGKPEWRAVDTKGKIHELPIAIELQKFTMEQYPARLMIIDNNTGTAQPEGRPQTLGIDEKSGQILDWRIKVDKYLEYAAPVGINGNTIKYVGWGTDGATDAALITATNVKTSQRLQGWISCGSYLFPFNVMKLNKAISLVMAEREPKKFSSDVKIYTDEEKVYAGRIEVNKPFSVMGWKIYQLDYDKEKGRWSEMSTFQLVKDPWLPAVYAGIFMMLAGAIGLFMRKNDKKQD
jgi:hypothetical protein